MASLSPEELKSLAQGKPEETKPAPVQEEIKVAPVVEEVKAAASPEKESLSDDTIAKLLGKKKKKDVDIEVKATSEASKTESTLDFKKRAEEMEADHLIKVKSSLIDDAPSFSVSKVIESLSAKDKKESGSKEDLGSDNDVHLKEDLRMNLTL